MPILNSINQMQDQMTEWRQDLHKIPEIGLQEFETSKYIKNKLSEFNIKFKDGYANTGVVAWVDGNEVTNDKTIGLRQILTLFLCRNKTNLIINLKIKV